jgi:hypothetical protein
MKRFTLCLLTPLVIMAQQGPPRGGRSRSGASQENQPAQIQIRPEDLCVLEGQVSNASTGEPLGKAALTLRRVDPPQGSPNSPRSYTASSDASGRFTIRDIDPASTGRPRAQALSTPITARDYLQVGATFSLDAKRRCAT